jgi:hypothetical protein
MDKIPDNRIIILALPFQIVKQNVSLGVAILFKRYKNPEEPIKSLLFNKKRTTD